MATGQRVKRSEGRKNQEQGEGRSPFGCASGSMRILCPNGKSLPPDVQRPEVTPFASRLPEKVRLNDPSSFPEINSNGQ
ncbi:hypothetical protein TNCT_49061 [Trichonephila clavata]|uniref:Uncharacterized protein n=1 Tax=Trichonephila clavata TaxID=2740835 RepID=A0A8X6IPW0_TRICU|nr:hypothetical protein TNCT_49061 [Trichonephila clavata]